MLGVAAEHHFHFDTGADAAHVMDAHFRSFGHKVVALLVKEGIACWHEVDGDG